MKTLFCCFYVLKSISLQQTASLVQVVFLALFVCVLLLTDRVLYHIFDIIRRHTFTEHSFTSEYNIYMHKYENLYYTLFSVPWNLLLFLLFTICYWFISSCATGSHDIHIDVRGESMLAKLLRKTIGAFNTSANIDLQTSNWRRWFSSLVHFIFFTLLCNYAVSFM